MSTRQPKPELDQRAAKRARQNDGKHAGAQSTAEKTAAGRTAAQLPQVLSPGVSAAAMFAQEMNEEHARVKAANGRRDAAKQAADSFEKNNASLRFANNRPSFVAFCLRFKAYLELKNLQHVIEAEAGSAAEGPAAEADKEQQRAVWYMLTVAAPSELQQALHSTLQQKTGYHAWKMIRERYLGPEAMYRQQLAQDFQNLAWQAGELFGDFEARFTALVAELEQANGQETSAADKQATLMRAIRQREGSSSTAYTRLYQMNIMLINRPGGQAEQAVSFADWMASMREEARRIEEDRASQQQQRAAAAASAAPAAAAPTVQLPMRLNAVAYGQGERPVCRNWAGFGMCVYGNACRYEHVAHPQGQPVSMPSRMQVQRAGGDRRTGGPPMAVARGGAGGQSRDNVCFKWKAGNCRLGAACRFAHPNQQQNGSGQQQRNPPAAQPQFQANVMYQAAADEQQLMPPSRSL